VDLPRDRIEWLAGAMQGVAIRGKRVPIQVASGRRPRPFDRERADGAAQARPHKKASWGGAQAPAAGQPRTRVR